MVFASLMAITFLGMSLPFCIAIFAALVLLSVVTYTEDLLCFKTLFAALLIAAAFYYDGFDQFNWHAIFRWQTAVGIIIYFSAGSAWLLFKWNKVSWKKKEEFDESWARRVAEAKEDGKEPPTDEDKRRLAANYIPYLRHNKERAFTWILLWPLSGVSYILGDLVRDFLEWILKSLGGLCHRITKSHFGDLMDDPKMDGKQPA